MPTYTPIELSTKNEICWLKAKQNKQRERVNKQRCCGSIRIDSFRFKRKAETSKQKGRSIERLKRVKVAPSPGAKEMSASQSENGIKETESRRPKPSSKQLDEANETDEDVVSGNIYEQA